MKVAAQTAPSGAKTSARSGFPDGFNPARIPDALNPEGLVIPPEIGDHSDVSEGLTTFP